MRKAAVSGEIHPLEAVFDISGGNNRPCLTLEQLIQMGREQPQGFRQAREETRPQDDGLILYTRHHLALPESRGFQLLQSGQRRNPEGPQSVPHGAGRDLLRPPAVPHLLYRRKRAQRPMPAAPAWLCRTICTPKVFWIPYRRSAALYSAVFPACTRQ